MSYLVAIEDSDGHIILTVGFITKKEAITNLEELRNNGRWDDYFLKLYKLIDSI